MGSRRPTDLKIVDCFALLEQPDGFRCTALKDVAFNEHRRSGKCGTCGCAFWKTRSQDREDRKRAMEHLRKTAF